MAGKVYIVKNPRGIQGAPVLRVRNTPYHEGALVRAGDVPADVRERLVRQGFLEERKQDV